MKRKAFPVFLALFALASCGGTQQSESSSMEPQEDISALDDFDIEERATYENHFADDKRLPGVSGSQCADPFVLRFNGRYYLYATSGGASLLCWESDDLLTWTRAGNNGNVLGVTDGSLQSPWAPEVRYINGKFYLISSFSGQKHSVLVSDSPTGPFVKHSDPFYENCIDGSFFVDSDETVYCTIASSLGIIVKRFNDELTDFKNDRFDVTYQNTKLGRWNEGPYITKRSGRYYLTYTGVDCYAPSYRVNYNYFDGESLDGIFNSAAFSKQGGSILLSTGEEYMGLGHSANFLGPDLDSVYIGYHDLTLQYGRDGSSNGNRRYFNFARLSFDGSKVVSDTGNDRYGNFVPARPEFESRDGEGLAAEGDFLLSGDSHGDTFSAEWNAIGEQGRYVFSYGDEENYSYITAGNARGIEIHTVSGGADEVVGSAALNKEYDFTKLHTYRISHDAGEYNFYFDDIEKISLGKAAFKGGRFGYMGKAAEDIGYSAFSASGLGSSDSNEYQKNQSLANAYDRSASRFGNGSSLKYYEETDPDGVSYDDLGYLELKPGDRASYLFHSDSDSVHLSIRVPSSMAGKRLSVRVNASGKTDFEVPSLGEGGFYLVSLGEIACNTGKNRLSVYAEGSDFLFSEIVYGEPGAPEGYSFRSGLSAYNASLTWVDHGRDRIEYTSGGMHSKGVDNDFVYIKDALPLGDVSASVKVAVNEGLSDKMANRRNALGSLTMDSIDMDLAYGAGIAIRVENHEYYYGGSNYEAVIDNLQGLYLGMNAEKIFLKDCNFSLTETVFEKEHSFPLGEKHELKLESRDGVVSAYLDGELLTTYVSREAPARGKVGLYSFFTDSTYSDFRVESI